MANIQATIKRFNELRLGKLVDQYKQKYPHVSERKICKLIADEHPELGISGDTIRAMLVKSKGFIETETPAQTPFLEDTDIEFPGSFYDHSEDFTLPASCTNILIVNDIHVPYHDTLAVKTAFRYAKDRGINTIILNGDFADFYQISRFEKSSRKVNFRSELEQVRFALESIRKTFPNTRIFFKSGNHEERLIKFLLSNAKQLEDLEELELPNLLWFKQYGIEPIPDKANIRIGKLNLLHGHEIYAGAGMVNVARTIRMKASDNIAVGHFHRTQEDYDRDIRGKITGGWAIGCLCGIKPDYMRFNKWNHGFALVEVEKSGMFVMHNKKIVNGEVR